MKPLSQAQRTMVQESVERVRLLLCAPINPYICFLCGCETARLGMLANCSMTSQAALCEECAAKVGK